MYIVQGMSHFAKLVWHLVIYSFLLIHLIQGALSITPEHKRGGRQSLLFSAGSKRITTKQLTFSNDCPPRQASNSCSVHTTTYTVSQQKLFQFLSKHLVILTKLSMWCIWTLKNDRTCQPHCSQKKSTVGLIKRSFVHIDVDVIKTI